MKTSKNNFHPNLNIVVDEPNEELTDDEFLDRVIKELKTVQGENFYKTNATFFEPTGIKKIYKKNRNYTSRYVSPLESVLSESQVYLGKRVIPCATLDIKKHILANWKIIDEWSQLKIYDDLSYQDRQFLKVLKAKRKEILEHIEQNPSLGKPKDILKFDPTNLLLSLKGRTVTNFHLSAYDLFQIQAEDWEYHHKELLHGPPMNT